jgi:hypothetical protein
MARQPPKLIRNSIDIDGIEAATPFWTSEDLEQMNTAFHQRMLDAIACDLEHCATAVSTKAGTRYPVHNYRRPE